MIYVVTIGVKIDVFSSIAFMHLTYAIFVCVLLYVDIIMLDMFFSW